MRISGRHALYLLPIVALLLGLSACTIKATTKTFTDIFTNFSSSTSGKSWVTADGLVKEDHKVAVFTTENFENLTHDMARGQGEYLASLSTLLGVGPERQAEFFAFAQERYPVLMPTERTPARELLLALHRELVASPTFRYTVAQN